MDILVKINEIQAKMALGLESKRGALRDLGEQFPDQKMQEIFEELMEDTKEQGALDLLRAQITQIQMATTGMRENFGDGPGLYGSWPLALAGVKNNTLDPKDRPEDIIDTKKQGGWSKADFAP